jgi:putative FmdB family regulatory protein
MPAYEYACTSCHRHFEVHQSFSDAPLEVCEVCGGKLKRVFHPVGIVLKGSGFYATDSRGKKSSSSAGGSKESGGKESGGKESSGSSSESKPAESKKETNKDSGSGSSSENKS